MTGAQYKVEAKKVLLVDDEPFNLALLRLALPTTHYQLSYAAQGQAALMLIHEDKPDLILLDILMPGLTGIDLCTLLKHNPLTAAIPVIMLSGLDSPADTRAARAAGAVGFIAKPFTAEKILSQIEQLTGWC
ncbi:MAG: response regulator [Rheinheimera sp.]|nr:response regulator [Rheinheimera sp.]